MNIKLSGIVAASMLAMMAIAPMGLAHDDSALMAGTGLTNDKVSGVAVGAADPRLQLVDVGEDISFAGGLCDMEVVTGEDDGSNERFVDGVDIWALPDTPSPLAGSSLINEGRWDDGGFGAVCHTTNMPGTTFDTWGCGGKYSSAINANDAVLGTSVWVIAGCDWGFASGGSSYDPTPFPGIDAYQNCAINTAILGNLGNPAAIPTDEQTCAMDFNGYAQTYDPLILFECVKADLAQPNTCPAPTGGSFTCHDGVTQTGQDFEETNSNYGGAVFFPTSTDATDIGEVLPGDCPDTAGVASLFVYNSVVVDSSAPLPVTEKHATVVTVS